MILHTYCFTCLWGITNTVQNCSHNWAWQLWQHNSGQGQRAKQAGMEQACQDSSQAPVLH